MEHKDENIPGSNALIMLFLLGFPFLNMSEVHDGEAGAQENQEQVQEASSRPLSNRHSSLAVSVELWRVWAVPAPQNISLMIRVDFANRTVSLRLRNDSGMAQFLWQDWVDAAMGCMRGIEEKEEDKLGYGRQILKADLRKPMVQLSPLRVNEDGMEPEVEKTTTARVWMGWPPFDVSICKFELDQWFAACNANLTGRLERKERSIAENEASRIKKIIEDVLREENTEAKSSTEGVQDS